MTQTLACPDGTELQLQAARGDIRIEPGTDPETKVSATRVVWVQKPLDAPAALNALAVQVDQSPERCAVTTLATSDMVQLGCAAYQVNLTVQVPPGVSVRVTAAEGQTRIESLSAPATISQGAGSIRAEDCRGPLDLTNQNGEIVVERAASTVRASALYGDCVITEATGALDLQCREGKTIVDGAGAGVVVRNNGGDVRLLALSAIGGPYDIRAENASVRLLLNPAASASISALTTRGEIHSVHSLQGTISGERREFLGRLNEGDHEIRIETVDGDIYLD